MRAFRLRVLSSFRQNATATDFDHEKAGLLLSQRGAPKLRPDLQTYKGPVLIRGRQLDGPHRIAVEDAPELGNATPIPTQRSASVSDRGARPISGTGRGSSHRPRCCSQHGRRL